MKHSVRYFILSILLALASPVLAIDQVDGVYQIGTAKDLVDFSDIVNRGNNLLNAVLTADIDMSGIDNFTPIGLQNNYGGRFDGQGHVISNLTVQTTGEAGLFGRFNNRSECGNNGGIIKNLGVCNANITSFNDRAGVICGELLGNWSSSDMENCYVIGEVTVSVPMGKQCGGMTGESAHAHMTNCYTTLEKLTGNDAGDVVFINCFRMGEADAKSTVFTAQQLSSGELCYLLNGKSSDHSIYFQNLPGDAQPVLAATHGVVYANGEMRCDGTPKSGALIYTNTGGSVIPDHKFDRGICSECGSYSQPLLAADGFYEIGNAGQLLAWAKIVGDQALANQSVKTNINARLTADIDLEGIDFQPICKHIDNDATYNCYGYGGIFDGQGYEIQNLSINCDFEAGFFSRVRDGEIKNLGIRNASVVTTANRAGILAGGSYSHINNCYIVGDLNIESTGEKGAFGGQIRFYSPQNSYTTHEAFYGSLHNTSLLNNCYYGDEVAEMAATGSLCYMLNGNSSDSPIYYQAIGKDAFPVLQSSHGVVYANGLINCDGTPLDGKISYSNSQTTTIPDHEYENGICVNCGSYVAAPQAEDGFYEISNAGNLFYFSKIVNDAARENISKKTDINARLMCDIDLDGLIFAPINKHIDDDAIWNTYGYGGIFDGQGHEIQNITIDADFEAGLFSRVRDGEIRNLGIRNASIITTNKRAGVIAGGGYSKFTNCYTCGNLYISAIEQVGGIAGECRFYNPYNCYTTHDNFYGNLHSSLAFDVAHNYWGKAIADDVLSGALAYRMNGSTILNPVWHQTIDEDESPVLNPQHGVVYCTGDGYADVHDTDSYAQFLDDFTAYRLKLYEDVPAQIDTKEAYEAFFTALAKSESFETYCHDYAGLPLVEEPLLSSAGLYANYIKEAQTIIDDITASGIVGDAVDVLGEYLIDVEEPGQNPAFANGTYPYITTNCLLGDDAMQAETEFLLNLYAEALINCYTKGSDISRLIVNPTLEKGFEGWNAESTCTTLRTEAGEGLLPAGEAYNGTLSMSQTITGLTNGVYELQLNAAYRACGDINNPRYCATFGLNDVRSFVMMESEDYVADADATDLVNCHLASDYRYVSELAEGYVPKGALGCSYAFNAGRYSNHLVALVDDGKLTITLQSPGTGRGKDWLGFGNFKLIYHGTADEATQAIDQALADMKARTQVIFDYPFSDMGDYEDFPNFPQSIREQLAEACDAVDEASDAAAKLALVERFSNLFAQVTEGRLAYAKMLSVANDAYDLSTVMFDNEVLDLNDYFAVTDWAYEILEAYSLGSKTIEEARNVRQELNAFGLPVFENGVMQIASARDLVTFSGYVNLFNNRIGGELVADIDMSGIDNFTPIGIYNAEKTDFERNSYGGHFDGHGHEIRNLNISTDGEGGLFGRCYLADIRNFGLVNVSITSTGNMRVGAVTGEMQQSEATNIYVTGEVNLVTDNTQCNGFSGESAWNSVYTNCWTTEPTFTVEKSCSMNNCYYGSTANTGLSTGELCYLLNGGQSDAPVWRQTIGQDAYPVLKDTSAIVYYKDSDYTNNPDDDDAIPMLPAAKTNAPCFDINGRVLHGPKQRGTIYIIDGKKVLY